MTSFRDVRCIFPIYPHTMTSSDQSADVSTNMTSYQMSCIFLRVLTLLYYHAKPKSSNLIFVGSKQGGNYGLWAHRRPKCVKMKKFREAVIARCKVSFLPVLCEWLNVGPAVQSIRKVVIQYIRVRIKLKV